MLFFLLIAYNAKAQSQFDLLKIQYDSLRAINNIPEALKITKQMNLWALENEGDTSLNYAVSFRYIGNCYEENDSALKYYELSRILLIKQDRIDNIEYGNCINNIGLIYSKNNNYKLSIENYQKALVIYKNVVGEDNLSYLRTLNNLATEYYKNNKQNEALETFELYNKITEQFLIKNNSNVILRQYIINSQHIIEINDIKNNIIEAENAIKKKLSLIIKICKDTSNIYLNELLRASDWYMNQKMIDNSIYLVSSCNSIIKNNNINNYEIEYQTFYRLGFLYREKNNLDSALVYYKKINDITIINEDNNSIAYANSLNNLGLIYLEKYQFGEAEKFMRRAYEIKKGILLKNNEKQTIVNTLYNLALVYGYLYDLENQSYFANITHETLLWLFENKREYFDMNMYIQNEFIIIANDLCYDLNGKALQRLDNIIKLLTKVNNIDNYRLIASYNMMGHSYYMLGDTEKAIKCFNVSLKYNNIDSIFNLIRTDDYKDLKQYMNSLIGLKSIYLEIKDYKNLSIIIERLQFLLKTNNSPIYKQDILEAKIKMVTSIGDNNGLKELLDEYTNSVISDLSSMSKYLTNDKLDKYINIIDFKYKNYFFQPELNSQDIGASNYNLNMIIKSIILFNSIGLKNAIYDSNDDELIKLYESYLNNKENYLGFNEIILDSLERELISIVGEYSALKRRFELRWIDVRNNLKNNESAIEFSKYFDEEDSSFKYMAQVLRPNYEYPHIVKLGSEKEIEKYKSGNGLSELYHLVWEPIDSLLEGVQTIYYSPDGLLYSVPFHALCTNDTAGCSYLMDKYTLHQLSTTRYLADSTLINTKPLNNTIALYGGINYEIVNDTINTNQEETNEDFLFANTLKRETTFKAVDYLPGTKQEVESIVPLLNRNKWTTTLSTGAKATEQLFKSKSDTLAPSIIHIATHGFAFPDKEEKRKKNNMDMLMLNNTQMQYTAAEDPMMRCGLMFAGANKSWTGKQKEMIEQTGQDGILTAAEVANMDLSNTKLVVLSACETGLGKVEGSEGVFGLQRGFKLAGVEQLIVSLWKVPDRETMELMNLFYTDLTITKDPVVSFSKAQKQMRNNYPDNPEKWAGFVLVR